MAGLVQLIIEHSRYAISRGIERFETTLECPICHERPTLYGNTNHVFTDHMWDIYDDFRETMKFEDLQYYGGTGVHLTESDVRDLKGGFKYAERAYLNENMSAKCPGLYYLSLHRLEKQSKYEIDKELRDMLE